ncbi:MAG: 3D domain-containing protein, partial [Acutalibacteraceae bacterium]|nr:3D domain-containing protein [Acutalibacteraceae bacterium]
PKTEKPSSRSVSRKTNGKNFRITVYTPSSDGGKWGYATSTGATSEHLKTCAVDPDVIPLGSIIEVNGIQLKAVDTGNEVNGNVVDIFYDGSSKEAREWINEFGEYHEVTIIE